MRRIPSAISPALASPALSPMLLYGLHYASSNLERVLLSIQLDHDHSTNPSTQPLIPRCFLRKRPLVLRTEVTSDEATENPRYECAPFSLFLPDTGRDGNGERSQPQDGRNLQTPGPNVYSVSVTLVPIPKIALRLLIWAYSRSTTCVCWLVSNQGT